MSVTAVVGIMHDMFLTTFWISVPILSIALVVGVIISLVQILTSIQDSSFSAVPRLAAFLVAMLFSMPWMLAKLMTYTTSLFGDLGRFAH